MRSISMNQEQTKLLPRFCCRDLLLKTHSNALTKENRSEYTVIVLAITSRCQKKKNMPTHIPIESSDLSMSSIALAEQVRTVDKSRLIHYVGRASKESMEAVDQALKISMGVE